MKKAIVLGIAALFLTGTASAAVIEIPAMTVTHSWIDMDNVGPEGATTVAAINAGGVPAGNIVDITLTAPTAAPGNYGFQPGQGRGLAGNPDGSLDLWLVDNDEGPFGAMGSMFIDLGMYSTEFGFSIGDWSGPCNLRLYDGATQVGAITIDFVGSPAPHFAQSDVAFNVAEISCNPDYTSANWVVPDLYVQIPEPASLALLGLGGIALLRRRR